MRVCVCVCMYVRLYVYDFVHAYMPWHVCMHVCNHFYPLPSLCIGRAVGRAVLCKNTETHRVLFCVLRDCLHPGRLRRVAADEAAEVVPNLVGGRGRRFLVEELRPACAAVAAAARPDTQHDDSRRRSKSPPRQPSSSHSPHRSHSHLDSARTEPY